MPTSSGAIWRSIGKYPFFASAEHTPHRGTASPWKMFGKPTRNWCKQTESPNGMVPTSVKTMPIARIGASVKSSLSAFGGMKSSFVKNFSPSAAGCSRPASRNSLPKIFTTARLGPMRSWIMELWRRSAQVRIAARFRTNPTMIAILMIVQTSCVAVMVYSAPASRRTALAL